MLPQQSQYNTRLQQADNEPVMEGFSQQLSSLPSLLPPNNTQIHQSIHPSINISIIQGVAHTTASAHW